MKKIDKLTPEQEAKVPQYLKKWLDIGRSTKPLDKVKAKAAVETIYECAGLAKPKNVLFFESPYQCQIAVNIMRESKDITELNDIVIRNFETNLITKLLPDFKKDKTNTDKMKYEYIFYANNWIYWVGFYDFILNELFPEEISKYESFVQYAKAVEDVHLFIPFQDTAFVSANPTDIHLNAKGQLHADLKPALLYKDGYSLYYLNGVKMNKDIVLANADSIDPKEIMKLTNVDERRELIRKVGIGRIYSELKTQTLHTHDSYELVDLQLTEATNEIPAVVGRYLKMTNPSIGCFHIEGVPNEVKTVQEALAWRNGMDTFIAPEILT